MKLNIYLDIDDVVVNWVPAFCAHYNCPIPTTWTNPYITLERLNEIKKNKNYWVTLPVKHIPNFQPKGYLSARSVPKRWAYEFMKLNNIPGRCNINQVPWNVSKIDKLKELEAHIFIDDKAETFLECHEHGIFCLLMDAPWNQHIETKYRIFDLNINKIKKKYKKWKQSIYS